MLISRLVIQVGRRLFNARRKTIEGVQSAKEAVFHGSVIVVSAVLIVWLSIFLYTAFHYAYMPSMSYAWPLHFHFKPCDRQKGVCSFPTGYVQLTKKQQLLMVGQPYKINLHLEMPESAVNKELGMFMVCAQLRGRDRIRVRDSCRSTMLHYRSSLLGMLTTLTFSPMMIFGSAEEKQNIVLELFGNFEEDQSHPITGIDVEIQSRHIEFYSAEIVINAHLTGLRYLMYHWPVLSAVIGISTNLFFITLVCTLSYLHFGVEDDGTDAFHYKRDEIDDESYVKTLSDLTTDSSTSEDNPLLEDVPKTQESSHSFDPALDEPSYIQEISTLIAESSSIENC